MFTPAAAPNGTASLILLTIALCLGPVLVFLDAQGKEVARHSGGLKSTEEALLLDRYVSEKHYRGTSFPAFKAARRG